jgi:hypothetical protein
VAAVAVAVRRRGVEEGFAAGAVGHAPFTYESASCTTTTNEHQRVGALPACTNKSPHCPLTLSSASHTRAPNDRKPCPAGPSSARLRQSHQRARGLPTITRARALISVAISHDTCPHWRQRQRAALLNATDRSPCPRAQARSYRAYSHHQSRALPHGRHRARALARWCHRSRAPPNGWRHPSSGLRRGAKQRAVCPATPSVAPSAARPAHRRQRVPSRARHAHVAQLGARIAYLRHRARALPHARQRARALHIGAH